jgi:hypothetical protein
MMAAAEAVEAARRARRKVLVYMLVERLVKTG